MAVYVDAGRNPYQGMLMCHMIADTLDELHGMASRLGLRAAWFQNKSFPHYDICQAKRRLALKLGAVGVGRHEFVAKMRLLRGGILTPQKSPVGDARGAGKAPPAPAEGPETGN